MIEQTALDITSEQMKSFWGDHDLSNRAIRNFQIGPLVICCRVEDDELWLAQNYALETLPNSDSRIRENKDKADEMSWSRWAVNGVPSKIRFIPTFPDKSIIVKPEYPYRLVPKAKVRFYVRVPLRVRIELLTDNYSALTEIPIIVSSLTWFGSFAEGELCYWVPSSVRRTALPDPYRPYLAMCPVLINNRSSAELFFEKVCLRVEALSVYSAQGQLWGNETRISYRGFEDISEIEITAGPPREAGRDYELLCGPLKPAPRGFTNRTFSSLKSLTGFGLTSS